MSKIQTIKLERRQFLRTSLFGLFGLGLHQIIGIAPALSSGNSFSHDAAINIDPNVTGTMIYTLEDFYAIFPPTLMANFNEALNHARKEKHIVDRKIRFNGPNQLMISTTWKSKYHFEQLYKNASFMHALKELRAKGISIKIG